nr:DUF4212 domain-containing protein [Halorussus sp. DT72]
MSDNNSRKTDNPSRNREPNPEIETDGGVATGRQTADTDYLDARVNIFKPSTPFMRDHLRIVWTMFAAWAVFVFGPVTATYLATDFMTSTTMLGFPLHYLLTAMGAPTGALLLAGLRAKARPVGREVRHRPLVGTRGTGGRRD